MSKETTNTPADPAGIAWHGTLSVSFSHVNVYEADGRTTATGTVTRTGDTSESVTVNLTSLDATEGSVPSSVVINAGEDSATFTFTSVDDFVRDGDVDTEVRAEASYYDAGTGSILVVDNESFCFAAGTLIASPDGERSVEDLRIGDLVLTTSGRAVPVRWLGRQIVPASTFTQPVRIRAGALGGGVPHSDLTVTGDHGMVVDGFIINASALVNGSTIDWLPVSEMPADFAVYHVETEAHDEILANGAATETFIDVAGRRAFDNYAEYLELYGVERIIPEMRRPRITSPRLLPQDLQTRLNIHAPETGFALMRDA